MISKATLDSAPPALRWVASISLFAVTILALANLPIEMLPIPWLLAFTLPGAIIGSWSRVERPHWQRTLLAVILQTSACYGALEWTGQMTRPAALACTILPPLAFTTTRNHDSDPSLALFLSLCVLIVGVILDGLNIGILLAYVVFANLSLHAATMVESHRVCNTSRTKVKTQTVMSDVMATTLMLLACAAASFAIEQTLTLLPSPVQKQFQAKKENTKANRRVGLDSAFILDGFGGDLADAGSNTILRAAHPDRQPVAGDIYLRSRFFTKASMHHWIIGPINRKKSTDAGLKVLRLQKPGIPVEQLKIERFDAAKDDVFLPPHTTQVMGLKSLQIDTQREWIKTDSDGATTYQVAYQNLPTIGTSERISTRLWQASLTQLPRKINLDRFNQLLDEWDVTTEPIQAMKAIANGLARHCQYSLREPSGPFRHKVDNFLFSSGGRQGYCMHFAAAAALMLRIKNIPCRIAVGLYGGTAEKGITGARIFSAQHAHAWIEVPFEDRGFVVFDPTPPAQRSHAHSNNEQATEATKPDDSNEPSLMAQLVELTATPKAWAFLVGAALLIWANPRRRTKHQQQHFPNAPQARRALKKLLRALAQAGHPRAPNQTLEMYAAELAKQNRLPNDIRVALTAYQETRFGGHAFDNLRSEQLKLGHKAAKAMQTEITVTDGTDK